MESSSGSDVWVGSICQMCNNSCGLKVHVVNGVVIDIKGDPEAPAGKGRLCAKGISGIMRLYAPNRVTLPLQRTNPEKGIGVDPQWQAISWEEALQIITEKLKKLREVDPRKLVVLSFDIDYIARFRVAWLSAFGTPNWLTGGADYFCGNALHPISWMTQACFATDPDLHCCNYLIRWGTQLGSLIAEDPVNKAKELADARERGMKVVSIDPICNAGAAKADEWIPIRPGTDGALAMAMLNVLLNEEGLYDAEFIKRYTNGPYLVREDGHYLRDSATNKPLVWDAIEAKAKTFDSSDIRDFALEGGYEADGVSSTPAFQLLKEHVRKYTCEFASNITTIPAQTIRRIATEYGQAAKIGSTIVIEGQEFPYRPACVAWRKGINQHKHAVLSCFAIQLLNTVVGSLDVPGGLMSVAAFVAPNKNSTFSWAPGVSEEGMLLPGNRSAKPLPASYPAKPVRWPEHVGLYELFPVAAFAEPMTVLNLINPEKFRFPYKPEVLLHARTNIMMTTVNPEQQAEWLKTFSFIVSFNDCIDETTEFADIVLPDPCYLERLDIFLSTEAHLGATTGLNDWYYPIRKPVVKPPADVKNWHEVLFELADRLGFRKEFYENLNMFNGLVAPYTFDPNKKYSYEEVLDTWAKSWFGPERGLNWFKEHGYMKWHRSPKEVYWRPFAVGRTPIYAEHFIRAGEDVKRVTEDMGIAWDITDYQPLPDWKPCPAYEENGPDYDLYAVMYRVPFHSYSHTANNIWLDELSERHPYAYRILINSQTAKKKGLRDEDLVSLETKVGDRVEGRVKLTKGIHPEAVGIAGCFGHWAQGLPTAKGKGVHFNRLLRASLESIDMLGGSVDECVKVRVSKIREALK